MVLALRCSISSDLGCLGTTFSVNVDVDMVVEVVRRLVHWLLTYSKRLGLDFDSILLRFFSELSACNLIQKSQRGNPCRLVFFRKVSQCRSGHFSHIQLLIKRLPKLVYPRPLDLAIKQVFQQVCLQRNHTWLLSVESWVVQWINVASTWELVASQDWEECLGRTMSPARGNI